MQSFKIYHGINTKLMSFTIRDILVAVKNVSPNHRNQTYDLLLPRQTHIYALGGSLIVFH